MTGHTKNEAYGTSISYNINFISMLGKHFGMIKHSGTPTNIPEYQHQHSGLAHLRADQRKVSK
jgi:hypothetical protein